MSIFLHKSMYFINNFPRSFIYGYDKKHKIFVGLRCIISQKNSFMFSSYKTLEDFLKMYSPLSIKNFYEIITGKHRDYYKIRTKNINILNMFIVVLIRYYEIYKFPITSQNIRIMYCNKMFRISITNSYFFTMKEHIKHQINFSNYLKENYKFLWWLVLDNIYYDCVKLKMFGYNYHNCCYKRFDKHSPSAQANIKDFFISV